MSEKNAREERGGEGTAHTLSRYKGRARSASREAYALLSLVPSRKKSAL